ncbi:hypothetical protein IAU59_003264 [Kwoniella sp. CBS 9459]
MTTTRSPEALDLLPSFLDTLNSPSSIASIPAPTLLGAITHFFEQLDSPHLERYINALLSSQSLWNATTIFKEEIREAVRVAVSARASRIDRETKDAYFANTRRNRKAQAWLFSVTRAVEETREEDCPEGARLHVLTGLLKGLDEVQWVEWGKSKRWIEEDLVYALSELLEGDADAAATNSVGVGLDERLYVLCEVIPCIDMTRLWALDVDKLTQKVQTHLYALLDTDTHTHTDTDTPSDLPPTKSHEEQVPQTARALTRTFQVLHSGGPSSRQNALIAMRKFCDDMRQRAVKMEEEWEVKSTSQGGDTHVNDDRVWSRHKNAFFAFLLPASTILDLLLSSLSSFTAPPPPPPRPAPLHPPSYLPETVVLSIHILSTLACFSYLTGASQGGFEHYHRIFYGCLDLISSPSRNPSSRLSGRKIGTDSESDSRVQASDMLLGQIWQQENEEGKMSDARAAFVLIVAEELVHHLSSEPIRKCMTLAERHVHRPQHRSSFEAAHAFLLALLRSAGESLDSPKPQAAFYDALLPHYLNIITKQANRGDITSEQLRSAFPLIVESASHHRWSSSSSLSSIQTCLSYLSTMGDSQDTRIIRIDIAPYIPRSILPAYLEDLGQMISSISASASASASGSTGERDDSALQEHRLHTDLDANLNLYLDLKKRAFEMVVRDLPDDCKSIGIDWWTRFERSDRVMDRKMKGGHWLMSRL